MLHPFRGGSTWYASLISLNCFSANSLRSGFLSGCHFSAALLYLRCGRFGCSALLQGADALRARTRAHWRLTLFRWPSCRSPFPRPALRSSTAASRVSLTPRTLANFLFAEPGSQPLRGSTRALMAAGPRRATRPAVMRAVSLWACLAAAQFAAVLAGAVAGRDKQTRHVSWLELHGCDANPVSWRASCEALPPAAAQPYIASWAGCAGGRARLPASPPKANPIGLPSLPGSCSANPQAVRAAWLIAGCCGRGSARLPPTARASAAQRHVSAACAAPCGAASCENCIYVCASDLRRGLRSSSFVALARTWRSPIRSAWQLARRVLQGHSAWGRRAARLPS